MAIRHNREAELGVNQFNQLLIKISCHGRNKLECLFVDGKLSLVRYFHLTKCNKVKAFKKYSRIHMSIPKDPEKTLAKKAITHNRETRELGVVYYDLCNFIPWHKKARVFVYGQ
jgi:hypothetical protein